VAKLAGDLSLAEDCAQEACAAAVEQWPREGLPANPGGWVVAVARRRALDHLRRESARAGKERQAVQGWAVTEPDGSTVAGDDQLALLFACCHPALDPASRVTLPLRLVCGLPAASIARLLLLPEPAIAQRIVRAKRKMPSPHTATLSRSSPPTRSAGTSPARSPPWKARLARHRMRTAWIATWRRGRRYNMTSSFTGTRRMIPVTTHARPRALQYKATMTRTNARCSAAFWVFARSATARPSCTE
jgi:DNA-directed RNA polymerase specialized sigma24 family protein